MKKSYHWRTERAKRASLIKKIGKGTVVKSVVIDRHHENGPEIHEISDTGIITIFNQRTKEMITQLIARPGQIRRYYKEDEVIPEGLIEIAREHQRMAFNCA